MPPLLRKRDFLNGLMMTGTGAGFLALSLGYPLGTPRNIGAGTFPAIVAALLVLVGLGVMLRAALEDGPRLEAASLKPVVLVLAGIMAFALLLPTAGYIVATIVLILLCAKAHPEFTWPGAIDLAAVVVVFGAAVFIYGLGLPIRLVGPLLQF